jgi:hypothetical protein
MKDKVEIITNNVPRDIVYAWELTSAHKKRLGVDDKELAELEKDGISFVIYKNYPLRVDDFMSLNFANENSPFGKFWHGYSPDTFFSGVLIHICEDGDQIIVGRYYS